MKVKKELDKNSKAKARCPHAKALFDPVSRGARPPMLKQHLRMGCNLSDARRQWQRVCGSRIFVTMRDSPGHCGGGSERGEGRILRVAR